MDRFTWTYGASERKTIFINDNSLQDPKGNGIGAITCRRIGNEEAERLAALWVAADDLLEACKVALAYFEQCVTSCDPEEEVKEVTILRVAITEAERRGAQHG